MTSTAPSLTVKLAIGNSDGWTLNGGTLSRLTAGNLLEGYHDQYVDLSCSVVSASWRRGALSASEFWLSQPGYVQVRLWDPNRTLDPSNKLGAYYTKLRAGIPLQLTANSQTGFSRNVFTGFLWSLYWENDYATITGTDILSKLAAVELIASTSVGAGDTGIQRIQRIFEAASLQAQIFQTCTGGRVMGATTLAGSCLTQVQDVVASEFGLLLVDGDGKVNYGPEWFAAARTETTATILNSYPEQITATTRPSISYGIVRNSIVARATGLTDVTASNQTSIDYYGLNKWSQLTTLGVQADLSWWAALALLWFKDNPAGVPSSLTIHPDYAGTAAQTIFDYLLQNEMIGREIALNVADIAATVQVYGVTHNVDARSGWSVTFSTIPNPFTFSATYWKLDSSPANRLDFANVLK